MRTRAAGSRLPDAPTDAMPGSPEKVRVLAQRLRLGVSLWHPRDARLPGEPPPPDAPAARPVGAWRLA